MSKNRLRLRRHRDDERAHYASQAEDIEYKAPFSWSEFEGIHQRGDYDLGNHGLTYKDEESGEEFTPWVIETSGGVDRAALFFLIDAYHEEISDPFDKTQGRPERSRTDDRGQVTRVILKLHPKLAPVKVAVFPLLANKPELVNKARQVFDRLRLSFHTTWDDRGNIGKRYFAQDEIGTPWCVTIDFQTLEDETVTVRDRDSAKQERIAVDKLVTYFQNGLA